MIAEILLKRAYNHDSAIHTIFAIFTENNNFHDFLFAPLEDKGITKLGLLLYGRQFYPLTLKAPITTAAENIHEYFFIVFLRK